MKNGISIRGSKILIGAITFMIGTSATFAGSLISIVPRDGGDNIQPWPPVSGGGGGGNVILASSLYWDVNGSTAGLGGTGAWNTSSLFWNDSTGTGTAVAWTDGNDAHFQGTAGTVTIPGGETRSPVTSFFEVTGYTLAPTNGTQTTLAGSISLSASVNLNLLVATTTADRIFDIGSVSGAAGSSLTLQGAQTAAGSNARILLGQASSSIAVPITISGAGTTFAGFVATNTGTGITGTITNNSGFTTLLGAAGGSDLTLSSTAVISGTAGVRIARTNSTANAGTVTLNAASNYSGGTTLDGGTLVLGDDAALGTGTLTLTNNSTSVLQAGGSARTLANNVVWGGNGTISGSNAFTFNGTLTSSGSSTRTLTVSNTGGAIFNGTVSLEESGAPAGRFLTINGTSAVTINGVVQDGSAQPAGLKYTGSSTLTLNNVNTYSGETQETISGSTIVVGASGTLGTGNVRLTAGTVTLTLSGPTQIASTATLFYVNTDTINLNYSGTDTIMGLTVDGVSQGAGVYGAGFLNPDGAFFGSGTITVVPEPTTVAMMALGAGLLVGVQRFRRKLR